ncbi:hypothetical protein [Amycolatopsis sp. 3B14]|uniref:hypothetical protein n=1 Tax=Amycolatopsis sp. 3B14 TaxID=3243600 RepID=UPI003D9640C3
MDDGYFGEDVAATYDQSEGPEFEPAAVDATVGFLAGLAASPGLACRRVTTAP